VAVFRNFHQNWVLQRGGLKSLWTIS